MPVQDCGAPDCLECQRAFGPDRRIAISHHALRASFYAAQNRLVAEGVSGEMAAERARVEIGPLIRRHDFLVCGRK